jgi:hypothetical protein
VLLLDGANPVYSSPKSMEGARRARQSALHREFSDRSSTKPACLPI